MTNKCCATCSFFKDRFCYHPKILTKKWHRNHKGRSLYSQTGLFLVSPNWCPVEQAKENP